MVSKNILKHSLFQLFIITLMLSPCNVLSQQGKPLEVSKDITAAILKDVWMPFMAAYNDLDIAKFKSIHTDDLTRVSIDMNKIETGISYLNNMGVFFGRVKKMNRQIAIKFSILSSATSAHKTYQTGYYCFSSRGSDTEKFLPRGYGLFNVILVKENGLWKIAMDADKQVEIDEDEFYKSGEIYQLE